MQHPTHPYPVWTPNPYDATNTHTQGLDLHIQPNYYLCASCRAAKDTGRNFQQCKAVLVCLRAWGVTNSPSASSTIYATQSCADIGQKSGGSKEGLEKGLVAVWERILL